jgi:hypothetical protein
MVYWRLKVGLPAVHPTDTGDKDTIKYFNNKIKSNKTIKKQGNLNYQLKSWLNQNWNSYWK